MDATTITQHGTVIDIITGRGIPAVNIISGDTGTITDENGKFQITVPSGQEISISHIGYEHHIIIATDQDIFVKLQPLVIPGGEVFVSATRAISGITPVAFSTITAEEIRRRYTVEDVPMILAHEPGVTAYSESGNGTGYSYVTIRGFDQSRIAVMIDNVPLNDNESHQVYWVDHADILSDASDIQIQRGIGNSLYGSAAFGGSINVNTQIEHAKPRMELKTGYGAYNTFKTSVKGASGPLLGNKLQMTGRYSQLDSDGYRDHHSSSQKALFLAGQYKSGSWINQFRALIGYAKTNLAWWGVTAEDINDREKRRAGYQAYLDDFLQQIYSLNSVWRIDNDLSFSNVVYLVKGSGYYENDKSESFDLTADDDSSEVTKYNDFLYEYNLDQYLTGDSSQSMDFTRRKWIINSYYGIIPTLTLNKQHMRLDIGGEIRIYSGNHYGEINLLLPATSGQNWRKYYQYFGDKLLLTGFTHFMLNPVERLRLIADLQIQSIHWTLDQKTIGNAAGHQLNADWQFINPRFGAVYQLNDQLSAFVNYGRGQKEPADNQIIEADDVFGQPVQAAAEVIDDYELGANFITSIMQGSVNWYRINYYNEQLRNIDIEQEGEYEYLSAASTRHQGLEFELTCQPSQNLQLGFNWSLNNHIFVSGPAADKRLPGIPKYLLNGWFQFNLPFNYQLFGNLRQVGEQLMPAQSSPVSNKAVLAYSLVDLGIGCSFGIFEVVVKINNLFDKLYITNGYDWDGWLYYWPGATRNGYFSVVMNL